MAIKLLTFQLLISKVILMPVELLSTVSLEGFFSPTTVICFSYQTKNNATKVESNSTEQLCSGIRFFRLTPLKGFCTLFQVFECAPGYWHCNGTGIHCTYSLQEQVADVPQYKEKTFKDKSAAASYITDCSAAQGALIRCCQNPIHIFSSLGTSTTDTGLKSHCQVRT